MSEPNGAEHSASDANDLSDSADAFEITDLRSGRRVEAGAHTQHTMRRPAWAPGWLRRQRLAGAGLVVCALVALVAVTPSLRSLVAPDLPWSPSSGSLLHHPLPSAPTPNSPAPDKAQWSALDARPLRLPPLATDAACPTTTGVTVNPTFGAAVGSGPLYAVGFGPHDSASLAYPASPQTAQPPGWAALVSVMVISKPGYTGPVLVRGGQLDGAHTLRFNGGIEETEYGYNGDLVDQASLPAIHLIVTGAYPAGSWYNEFIYARFQAPGCYALQLDGLTFTEVIAFRALPVS